MGQGSHSVTAGRQWIDWGAVTPDCEFCGRDERESRWYEWAAVQHSERFVVVAALGAIVPGYVLVLPRRHCASFLELTADEYDEGLQVVESVKAVYAARGLAEWTVFEHGCPPGHPASGCVAHAHWHLVPVAIDLPDEVEWQPVASFSTLRQRGVGSGDYLYLETPSGAHVAPEVPNRQFLRRHLAKQVGRSDEWDYATFPHFANVRETIRMFESG
jgi:diadenosine tetraphosphate (Ap4A) HIT family hydrolase